MTIQLPLPLTLRPTTFDALIEQWRQPDLDFWPICFGTAPQAQDLAAYLRDLPPAPIDRIERASIGIYQRLTTGIRYDEACDEAFFDDVDQPNITIPLLAVPTTPQAFELDAQMLADTHTTWHTALPVYTGSIHPNEDWKILAALELGGINRHPMANEHTALLRYWSERFHTRVLSCTLDSLTLFVGAPPQDWKTAFDVAQDHIDYCPQRLNGHNLQTLAKQLQTDTLWHFQWDIDAPQRPTDLLV